MNEEVALTILAAVVLGIALLLNGIASIGVARDFTSERRSKWAWLVFIWLVPIVGGLLALRTIGDVAPEALPYLTRIWPLRWLIGQSASDRMVSVDLRQDHSTDLSLADSNLLSSGHDHHAD